MALNTATIGKISSAHHEAHKLMDGYVPIVNPDGTPMTLAARIAWLMNQLRLKKLNDVKKVP